MPRTLTIVKKYRFSQNGYWEPVLVGIAVLPDWFARTLLLFRGVVEAFKLDYDFAGSLPDLPCFVRPLFND